MEGGLVGGDGDGGGGRRLSGKPHGVNRTAGIHGGGDGRSASGIPGGVDRTASFRDVGGDGGGGSANGNPHSINRTSKFNGGGGSGGGGDGGGGGGGSASGNTHDVQGTAYIRGGDVRGGGRSASKIPHSVYQTVKFRGGSGGGDGSRNNHGVNRTAMVRSVRRATVVSATNGTTTPSIDTTHGGDRITSLGSAFMVCLGLFGSLFLCCVLRCFVDCVCNKKTKAPRQGSGYVEYRSNTGGMFYVMQIVRLPPSYMSKTVQMFLKI